VDKRENALVIPMVALVDVGGKRGVFMTRDGQQGQVASFKNIDVGLMDQNLAEVTSGLSEGQTVVTTGAAALREGDRVLLPGQTDQGGQGGGAGRGRGRGQGGQGGQGGRRGGGQGTQTGGGNPRS
jgi:hypothetical protein